MPTYLHTCTTCNHEWELVYGMTEDPPTECPNCHAQTAKRLISFASPGKVELSGHELKEQVAKETKDFVEQVKRDPNLKANLLGENKFHEAETQRDRVKQTFNEKFFRRYK